ncbi:Serine/threonine-protein kinase ppk19 [Pelomyxa schiedti]|nr:Serine/threonine-protein kinase ppk19 [Pelomyxa schiedti]
MGNRLALTQQAFNIEFYVHDVPRFSLARLIGKGRFLKTLQGSLAREQDHHDIVVKVFPKWDPNDTPALQEQIVRLKGIRDAYLRVENPNVFPFVSFLETEKAGYMIRQYFANNLSDRISTLPFLTIEDKLWITYQLLRGVEQSHKLKICHGDIKCENVMLTSSNWVFLSDPAPYKPVYLPEDNPADFSFFFDNMGRRTCYIAPERFYKSGTPPPSGKELELSMDVFSLGCVIAELFLEGTPLFDLSQLLDYRKGDYDPSSTIHRIPVLAIQDLVSHMVQKVPERRKTVSEYLSTWSGTGFPYFYNDFHSLASHLNRMAPDDRIMAISRQMKDILVTVNAVQLCEEDDGDEQHSKACSHHSQVMETISSETFLHYPSSQPASPLVGELPPSSYAQFYDSGPSPSPTVTVTASTLPGRPAPSESLVIFLALLTSCTRSAKLASSRLVLLKLFRNFAKYVGDEARMQRLLPYTVSLLSDEAPLVRAEALKTLAYVLKHVNHLPSSDTLVFPEYILPALQHLKFEEKHEIVRLTFARYLPILADSSRRFLEAAHLYRQKSLSGTKALNQQQENFDTELVALHKGFHDIVQDLLTRFVTSPIKIAFTTDVTRLCTFFGHQRTNDFLLPLIISFLNDKDWRLRCTFFVHIVGISLFVGQHSLESFILPCIQQAFYDQEEFVIDKAISSVACLCDLGLFRSHCMYELCEKVAPLLLHPNVWIRYGAIAVIDSICKKRSLTDVHCFILPRIRPFIVHPLLHITQVSLLQSLHPPVSRTAFQKAIDLNLTSISPSPPCQLTVTPFTLKKSPQLTPEEEGWTINLKLKAALEQVQISPSDVTKILKMEHYIIALSNKASRREEEATGLSTEETFLRRSFARHSSSSQQLAHKQEAESTRNSSDQITNVASTSPPTGSLGASAPVTNITTPGGPADVLPTPPSSISGIGTSLAAHMNLGPLVGPIVDKDMIRDFKPTGIPVGHLCEHTAAITQLKISQDNIFFASASKDGSVKIWDSKRLEKHVTNRSRKTFTFDQGKVTSLTICDNSHSIAAATDTGSIALFKVEVSDATANTPHRYNRVTTLKTCENTGGSVVQVDNFQAGEQFVVVYATSRGQIAGWDIRAPADKRGEAFVMHSDPKYGVLQTFVLGPENNWLVSGTCRGYYTIWDLRFCLPVRFWRHHSKSRIYKLIHRQSTEIISASGCDEVVVWDVAKDAVKLVFQTNSGFTGGGTNIPTTTQPPLQSPLPPMDYGSNELQDIDSVLNTIPSASSILKTTRANYSPTASLTASATASPTSSGIADFGASNSSSSGTQYVQSLVRPRTLALMCHKTNFVMTAGSDRCIRYWDTTGRENSYTVCGPDDASELYTSQKEENVLVLRCKPVLSLPPATSITPTASSIVTLPPEYYSSVPYKNSWLRTVVHQSPIVDLGVLQVPHNLLLSASRDGVIKVWR